MITLDKLEMYAVLESQKREIELKQAAIKAELLPMLADTAEKRVEIPAGMFTVETRKTWEYTPATQEMEKQLKQTQKDEQRDGAATYTEAAGIKFLPKKAKQSDVAI